MIIDPPGFVILDPACFPVHDNQIPLEIPNAFCMSLCCRFEHPVGNGCGISKIVVAVVKAAALPKGAGRLAWLAER